MIEPICQFESEQVDNLMAHFRQLLIKEADSLGVAVSLDTVKWCSDHIQARFRVQTATTDGTMLSPEAAEFNKYARFLGLKPEHLYQQITHCGKEYIIWGADMRKRKHRVMLRRVEDSRLFRLDPHNVLLGLRSSS